MQLYIGNSYSLATIIHELGHILGLTHEHMRKDRDTYVKFRCKLLSDFAYRFGLLKKIKPTATMSDLCDNIDIAIASLFSGRDYVKGWTRAGPWGRDQIKWPVEDRGEPYDLLSIMHYPSWTSDSVLCDIDHEEYCPLVSIHDL
jgi:hypothetical protein